MKLKVLLSFLFASVCLSIVSIGIVSANSGNVIEKQSEIDKYIFEDHAEEIADKGITVTHTGPLNDEVVEIGITPFNEENANYFYGIFGEDDIKVVEGTQATTLGLASDSTVVEEGEMIESAEVLPQTNSTNEKSPLMNAIYIVLIVGIATCLFLLIRKRKRVAE